MPVTTYDSSMTLRELAAGEGTRSSTPKNPLDKVAVLVVPDQLGSKSPTCSPSGGSPRTHIVLKRREEKRTVRSVGKKMEERMRSCGKALGEVRWKEIWDGWWMEVAFWGVATLFMISE